MRAADRTFDDWLKDLHNRADLIVKHTESKSIEEFAADEVTRTAVVKWIEDMGEAAKNVRDHFPSLHSTITAIPWKDLTQMRNRLNHGYFDISYAVVWQTARNDLPRIRDTIERVQRNRSAARAAGRQIDPSIRR